VVLSREVRLFERLLHVVDEVGAGARVGQPGIGHTVRRHHFLRVGDEASMVCGVQVMLLRFNAGE
jgi:hypothetical protein